MADNSERLQELKAILTVWGIVIIVDIFLFFIALFTGQFILVLVSVVVLGWIGHITRDVVEEYTKLEDIEKGSNGK